MLPSLHCLRIHSQCTHELVGTPFKEWQQNKAVECTVCSEPLNKDSPTNPWYGESDFAQPACPNKHVFHMGCLAQWLINKVNERTAADPGEQRVWRVSCPDCRADLRQVCVDQLYRQIRLPEPSAIDPTANPFATDVPEHYEWLINYYRQRATTETVTDALSVIEKLTEAILVGAASQTRSSTERLMEYYFSIEQSAKESAKQRGWPTPPFQLLMECLYNLFLSLSQFNRDVRTCLSAQTACRSGTSCALPVASVRQFFMNAYVLGADGVYNVHLEPFVYETTRGVDTNPYYPNNVHWYLFELRNAVGMLRRELGQDEFGTFVAQKIEEWAEVVVELYTFQGGVDVAGDTTTTPDKADLNRLSATIDGTTAAGLLREYADSGTGSETNSDRDRRKSAASYALEFCKFINAALLSSWNPNFFTAAYGTEPAALEPFRSVPDRPRLYFVSESPRATRRPVLSTVVVPETPPSGGAERRVRRRIASTLFSTTCSPSPNTTPLR